MISRKMQVLISKVIHTHTQTYKYIHINLYGIFSEQAWTPCEVVFQYSKLEKHAQN